MSSATPTPLAAPAILNLPNSLTLGRLVLAFALFACIAAQWWWTGLAIFVLAAISDWLDGFLARRYGLQSAFGRNFDPLVDKVLICGAYIFLMPEPLAGLAPWMVTVVVARELIITGLRSFIEAQAGSFGADGLGKIKMVLQCAALIAILVVLARAADGAPVAPLQNLQTTLVWSMILATALSGLQYVARAVTLLRAPS